MSIPQQLLQRIMPRTKDVPMGNLGPRHQHEWGQLQYAVRGVLQVDTSEGRFISPPNRAVWIPPHVDHQVTTLTAVQYRSIYVDLVWTQQINKPTCVIEISPLVKELILYVMNFPHTQTPDLFLERIWQVLVDQLCTAAIIPYDIPLPAERRLQPIINELLSDPTLKMPLEYWEDKVGASARTLRRLFQQHTGMGFNQWRQRLVILHGLELLDLGKSITDVALSLGYESSSSFSTMFKRQLGESPSKYLQRTYSPTIKTP
ncbi:AraC family transcriptional regulator [Zooshikella harenae]|uniref:Helix-turn-helix transcriptional regulator n=1 Tax=Zooshikella harenae TaxID=2827238 RepID=A0ABS5ZDZ1_9GAMM|nr:helix-turn-helix transcriptional regulator [Zooshikella harenae]MBU2712283.1 helix-turn-helix transcriptional regulator [Zooshikella harenae]